MSSYQLSDLLITPAKNSARAVIILAHGSGAGMRHHFMSTLAEALAEHDFEVVRFNFPYMQLAEAAGKPRPPSKMPMLIQAMREVIQLVSKLEPDLPLIIAGKSLGARVASQVLTHEQLSHEPLIQYRIEAGISFGYPFHPPGKADKLRLSHFDEISKPHLVLQGTRDPFGKRNEVESYSVGRMNEVIFVESGEHSFIPLKSSGVSQQTLIEFAADQSAEFIQQQLMLPNNLDNQSLVPQQYSA